jgi:hypothetical protein
LFWYRVTLSIMVLATLSTTSLKFCKIKSYIDNIKPLPDAPRKSQIHQLQAGYLRVTTSGKGSSSLRAASSGTPGSLSETNYH